MTSTSDPIDLHVVLELQLAFDAGVEGLAALPVAVTMALKDAAARLRQRHRVVARPWYPDRLDESLLAEMSEVTRTRISRTIVAVT